MEIDREDAGILQGILVNDHAEARRSALRGDEDALIHLEWLDVMIPRLSGTDGANSRWGGYRWREEGDHFVVVGPDGRDCDWPPCATRAEALVECIGFERAVRELDGDERSEARGLAMMAGDMEGGCLT